VGQEPLDALIPSVFRAECERRAAEPDPLRFPSPLPDAAAIYYTSAGCWSLAIALHEETGLPIELYCHRGRPTHAYVLDGDRAIDYRGRIPAQMARAGAERVERSDPAGIEAHLEKIAPLGVKLIAEEEYRVKAATTARLILSAEGMRTRGRESD
jgi:hypothetical protein